MPEAVNRDSYCPFANRTRTRVNVLVNEARQDGALVFTNKIWRDWLVRDRVVRDVSLSSHGFFFRNRDFRVNLLHRRNTTTECHRNAVGFQN